MEVDSSSHLVEYVATFPNVTVNAGNDYKACVVRIKDLELTCKIGNNSSAARPEFVDISLNATDTNLALNTAQMLCLTSVISLNSFDFFCST